jgi:hypothetical protein
MAIIGSLIFVGIESRNSTKQAALTTQALEITAYQELMTNIEELNVLGMHDDRAASVMARIWNEPDDLELFRETRVFFLLFRHGDMAYFMYERGAISEDRFRSILGPLPLNNQRGRDFWQQNKMAFTAGYREYIDGIIANAGEDVVSR